MGVTECKTCGIEMDDGEDVLCDSCYTDFKLIAVSAYLSKMITHTKTKIDELWVEITKMYDDGVLEGRDLQFKVVQRGLYEAQLNAYEGVVEIMKD